MPLRVTIELIPFGDEKKKKTLAKVDIVNNLKGTPEKGNYDVSANVYKENGKFDIFFKNNIKGIKRGDVLFTVAECLRKLIK